MEESRTAPRVRFDLAAHGRRAEMALRERMADARGFFGGEDVEQGRIVKMEKMLVREDATAQKKLPDDFDENSGQGVVSVNRRKWREYVVVCRRKSEGAEAAFVLQIYMTRVIPALEKGVSTKPKYEIPLDVKVSRCNLYSSLDKTLVIWQPGLRGTRIFILQSPSASSSVEWLTFIRGVLGFDRPQDLLVKVPEVDINLRIEDPFSMLHMDENSMLGKDDADLLVQSIAREEAVAPRIVERCLDMISKSDEWSAAVAKWTAGQRVGLAWKRYDRLEWVHGANERRMYGTIAMAQSHELELRPKVHYPTAAVGRSGAEMREPVPVEGFLVRLTSQSGNHRRLGRAYSRRLYFATFDQFLMFTAPRHGDPPEFGGRAPRRLLSARPTAGAPAAKKPLVYEVDPFPVKDGKLEWLDEDAESVAERDRFAHHEFDRRRGVLEKCEGYIDLCSVVRVRGYHEPKPGEPEVVYAEDEGDEQSDEDAEEGGQDDRAKIFELVLSNGLAVRLKAYSLAARREWTRRLRELVRYWRARKLDDVRLHRRVRARNLEALQVDEEGEAWVGAFARKWELARTRAEPALHSFCPATRCRAVLCSGPLYVKPRLRGTFVLRLCVLVPGALLMFEAARRGSSGAAKKHVHHARTARVGLEGCYLYSGLLTDADLLYHDRGAAGFDAAAPGHHAVPRVWPEDGWDGWDEDVMACFVLWRPGGRSWFRHAHGDGDDGARSKGGMRLKRVSALGKKGNRVVFRARGRAERDRWVLALAGEMERAGREVEVRIVGDA
jgi:hypothetical protein